MRQPSRDEDERARACDAELDAELPAELSLEDVDGLVLAAVVMQRGPLSHRVHRLQSGELSTGLVTPDEESDIATERAAHMLAPSGADVDAAPLLPVHLNPPRAASAVRSPAGACPPRSPRSRSRPPRPGRSAWTRPQPGARGRGARRSCERPCLRPPPCTACASRGCASPHRSASSSSTGPSRACGTASAPPWTRCAART